MEKTFQSQIDAVLATIKELVSYNLPHPVVETSDTIQAGSHQSNQCSFGTTRGIRRIGKEGPERQEVSIRNVEGLETQTSATSWHAASGQAEGHTTAP